MPQVLGRNPTSYHQYLHCSTATHALAHCPAQVTSAASPCFRPSRTCAAISSATRRTSRTVRYCTVLCSCIAASASSLYLSLCISPRHTTPCPALPQRPPFHKVPQTLAAPQALDVRLLKTLASPVAAPLQTVTRIPRGKSKTRGCSLPLPADSPPSCVSGYGILYLPSFHCPSPPPIPTLP